MDLGLIGLGKMGGNMRERIRRAGHTVVGYDHNPDVSDVDSLEAMVEALPSPKVVWVMVPAGDPTRQTVKALKELLSEGDLIVDGGNSRWTDDQANARFLSDKGIGFVDCGVSGGVWGLENGYALMAGGDADQIAKVQPIFDALKPEGEFGWVHAGSSGAGHFSKMVHNGIEYALMAAYAEGLNVIRAAGVGKHQAEADAETAPLREPRYYPYDSINLGDVAEVWRRGSVIGSWLLDLTADALVADPGLDQFTGRVSDSGEGRWTSIAAIEEGVSAPLLTAALYSRFASRGSELFADKVESAQRKEFGGHDEKPAAS